MQCVQTKTQTSTHSVPLQTAGSSNPIHQTLLKWKGDRQSSQKRHVRGSHGYEATTVVISLHNRQQESVAVCGGGWCNKSKYSPMIYMRRENHSNSYVEYQIAKECTSRERGIHKWGKRERLQKEKWTSIEEILLQLSVFWSPEGPIDSVQRQLNSTHRFWSVWQRLVLVMVLVHSEWSTVLARWHRQLSMEYYSNFSQLLLLL